MDNTVHVSGPVNMHDAAYHIGQSYPGGVESLAGRMQKSAAVLRSKLNPNMSSHVLTLQEALDMQAITGKADILQAMAAALGYAVVPLPSVVDDDIDHAIRQAVVHFGAWMGRVDEALSDGLVTINEARRNQEALVDMIARAQHLQGLMAAKAGMTVNG